MTTDICVMQIRTFHSYIWNCIPSFPVWCFLSKGNGLKLKSMECRGKGVQGYSRKILLSCMITVVLMNTWDYIVFPGSSTLLLPRYRLVLALSGGLEAQDTSATKAFFPWGLQINWPPSVIVRAFVLLEALALC